MSADGIYSVADIFHGLWYTILWNAVKYNLVSVSQKHKKAYHVSAFGKILALKSELAHFWVQTTFFVKSPNDINKVKV